MAAEPEQGLEGGHRGSWDNLRRQIGAVTGIDALRQAVPSATSLTLYMCWHGGVGHGYPQTVLDAARRLRERHTAQGASDNYISVTFAPAEPDVEDFLSVAPYSDLAYVTDASGVVLAEVSGP